MHNEQPHFTAPTIRASDLNKVANAAFGWLTIDGGDIERSMWGTNITVPSPKITLKVRVHRINYSQCLMSSVNSGTSDSSVPGVPHSWELVEADTCGRWKTARSPFNLEGDIITNPAFERNNGDGTDNTIQEITPRLSYYQGTKFVTEWEFVNGGSGGRSIGPDCIITASQQVCCDQESGFSAEPWYIVFVNGAQYWLKDRQQAIDCAQANGLTGCIDGECPPEE